jgi:hypothetical protein
MDLLIWNVVAITTAPSNGISLSIGVEKELPGILTAKVKMCD